MAYERRVHRHLQHIFDTAPTLYLPAQWIAFRARGAPQLRWAQPDGLLIDLTRGLIVIVEIKLRHMDKAWWWCRQLYEPLLTALFPSSWTFACLEVTRSFDPEVVWPEPLHMVRSPDLLRAGQFGCHIWGGRAG